MTNIVRNITKRTIKSVVGAAVLVGMVGGAHAATIVDKKIAQFGIEPRVTCGKWVKPWAGAKICIGRDRD